MIHDFLADFDSLIERVFVKKQPTVFVRYGDGELALMIGDEIPSYSQACIQDGWTAPKKKTLLGKDLINSLKNIHPDWFIGIPCDCCNRQAKRTYLYNLQEVGVDIKNITYANLFINSNYLKFKNIIANIKEEVVLLANKAGKNSIYPFNVKKFISIEDDCVNFWESQKESYFNELSKFVSQTKNTLFLISAGPMSEPIIDFLWNLNKTNRYIDVGSSLDEYTKNKITRPYMIENSEFFDRKCKMKISIFKEDDFSCFIGGWSYEGKSIYNAFCNLNFEQNNFKILEFGCGDSSEKIFNLIKKYYPDKNIIYDAYEHQEEYLLDVKGINCHLYNENEIDFIALKNVKYDFVLIDGPHGINRKKWYKKISSNIKQGSIILIDDYDHFIEFEQSLVLDIGSKWEYSVIETIYRTNIQGSKTWKIVKIEDEKKI